MHGEHASGRGNNERITDKHTVMCLLPCIDIPLLIHLVILQARHVCAAHLHCLRHFKAFASCFLKYRQKKYCK